MKQYNIVILPNAEQDIEASYLYIKEDSPQNALNWYQVIYRKIPSLSTLPLRCPPFIPLQPTSRDDVIVFRIRGRNRHSEKNVAKEMKAKYFPY